MAITKGKGIILCPTTSAANGKTTTSDCMVAIYATGVPGTPGYSPTSATNLPIMLTIPSGTPTTDTTIYKNLQCVICQYDEKFIVSSIEQIVSIATMQNH